MKTPKFETVTLDKIVGGGQALGTLTNGRKAFVWGGLPGEQVTVSVTKAKSNLIEGFVTAVIKSSNERIAPKDPASYLSTSPWQIMDFDAEQHYKAALIEEAFELHDIVLPNPISVYTDGKQYNYRNKVEFSWYGANQSVPITRRSELDSEHAYNISPHGVNQVQTDEHAIDQNQAANEKLDLAFFRRGTKGKIVVENCALLPDTITNLAHAIRDLLQQKNVRAGDLKTVIIRCDQLGNCVWQLYVKTLSFDEISDSEAALLPAAGGEVIYSDPKSPASRITKRLHAFGDIVLTDTILGVPFHYATEGFFQINLPVYEQALKDMKTWIPEQLVASSMQYVVGEHATPQRRESRLVSSESLPPSAPLGEDARFRGDEAAQPATMSHPTESVNQSERERYLEGNEDREREEGKTKVIDLYAGVGSIGLTIGGDSPELIEINEDAVREMKRNIKKLHSNATAILAPSEKALDYITGDKLVIVDPPRAGLHKDVIDRLLKTTPQRIIYLSCNPVTQARDVALLSEKYGIAHHQGYNFFPRTPHIEHLVILDTKSEPDNIADHLQGTEPSEL